MGKPVAVPYIYLITLLTVILFLAVPALALENASKSVMDEFINQTSGWWGILRGYALQIFGLALTLDIALFGIRMALQRSDLGEILSQFVMLLLFAGFIAAVIMNYEEWATGVAIKGLGPVATSLTSQSVDVGSPFKIAEVLWMKTSEVSELATSFSDFGKAFLYMGTVMLIIIVMFLLCALMIIVKCEFYILANVGILLIGLGGSKIFKDYAINVMRYILSVAIKVFVIQLIASVGLSMIDVQSIANNVQTTGGLSGVSWSFLFVLLAKALILICLAKTLPETCAGIVNGSVTGGGNPLASAARTAGTMAFGAASGGAGYAVGAAAGAAGAVRDSYTVARASGASGIGGTAGGMIRAMMDAHSEAKAAGAQKQLEANPDSMKNQLRSSANAVRAARAISGDESEGGAAASSGGASGGGAAAAPSASADTGGVNSSPSLEKPASGASDSRSSGSVDMRNFDSNKKTGDK